MKAHQCLCVLDVWRANNSISWGHFKLYRQHTPLLSFYFIVTGLPAYRSVHHRCIWCLQKQKRVSDRSKSSQVILAPDIIHFSVSEPFKPFSTNTGRKSPLCAEQSLECETSHSLRIQKRLPFQNKANIWVFPGCTITLVHKCPHCRLLVL